MIHNKFLTKVPIDYKVKCCNDNGNGKICHRDATFQCPVGLNNNSNIICQRECGAGMCVKCHKEIINYKDYIIYHVWELPVDYDCVLKKGKK